MAKAGVYDPEKILALFFLVRDRSRTSNGVGSGTGLGVESGDDSLVESRNSIHSAARSLERVRIGWW